MRAARRQLLLKKVINQKIEERKVSIHTYTQLNEVPYFHIDQHYLHLFYIDQLNVDILVTFLYVKKVFNIKIMIKK